MSNIINWNVHHVRLAVKLREVGNSDLWNYLIGQFYYADDLGEDSITDAAFELLFVEIRRLSSH